MRQQRTNVVIRIVFTTPNYIGLHCRKYITWHINQIIDIYSDPSNFDQHKCAAIPRKGAVTAEQIYINVSFLLIILMYIRKQKLCLLIFLCTVSDPDLKLANRHQLRGTNVFLLHDNQRVPSSFSKDIMTSDGTESVTSNS